MGLLKQFRSKVRHKDDLPVAATYSYSSRTHTGRDVTQQLPANVLGRIFSHVCPHSQDFTYQTSEESPIGDGCMLCDLRDLANCTQVCKRWRNAAHRVLYTSVRIDAVHYCALEEELAIKRKKAVKHFRSKSYVEPGNIPGIRLALLCRTLRDDHYLAQHTQLLKLPYMTRESCRPDLARTVSALPNLRYVDLPDGFYSGDANSQTLREELQAQCPSIRKMLYRRGAERHLEFLLQGRWQQIEILQLSKVSVEPGVVQLVLAALPAVRDLTLSDLPWLDDSIFEQSSLYPDLVPLQLLKLVNTPNVTIEGLTTYFRVPSNKETLRSLTLHDTGIVMSELHTVLWKASALEHLSIQQTVSKSLVLSKDLPSLTSISLKVLNFEIVNAATVNGIQRPSESYYAYLASSLHASALPALSTLYVRDQVFPERMIISAANTTSRSVQTLSIYAQPFALQQSSFNQTLEIFSKGINEHEWVLTAVAPTMRARRPSTTSVGRPLSAYSASRGLGPQWAQGGFGGEARKSVVVGNGFGGFLAVPTDEVPASLAADARAGAHDDRGDDFLRPPPSMSNLTGSPKMNDKRGSKHDLWR